MAVDEHALGNWPIWPSQDACHTQTSESGIATNTGFDLRDPLRSWCLKVTKGLGLILARLAAERGDLRIPEYVRWYRKC
jgi:hypothetical protein